MKPATILPFKRAPQSNFTCYAFKETASTPSAMLYESRVSAGFPSPASDYVERPLDLNTLLVKNPPATFFVRVDCDVLSSAGIFKGDLAIVDRSILPKAGSIIIIIVEGEAVLRRLEAQDGRLAAVGDTPRSTMIALEGDTAHIEIWGVVTHVIHKV